MGRGSWNQYYRDSICDKADIIKDLEKNITVIEPKKANSWLDYFKPSFYKKTENENEKEIVERIESLRKSIKSDELEMY